EERESLGEFGDTYARYMREVPAFIPRLSAQRANASG
ncbi:MAG: isoprenylcysteine carboxyl methyltransferase, partial [Sphingomonas hengshuiensis]